MSSESAIRGVIFDMDGVLCDSEPFICEAAIRMFAEVHGAEVPEDAFVPFVGRGEDAYLGGPAEARGIPIVMPRDKVTTYEIYLEIIKGRLPPLPGVVDFTAELRAAGIKHAVASAADLMKVEGNLCEIGVPAERFDTVVTGSDVANKKPAPDGFLLAAKRLGLPASECLVVEDAINGVQAALAAGATCLALTTSFSAGQLTEAGAHHTAPSLAEVPPVLRARLGLG